MLEFVILWVMFNGAPHAVAHFDVKMVQAVETTRMDALRKCEQVRQILRSEYGIVSWCSPHIPM